MKLTLKTSAGNVESMHNNNDNNHSNHNYFHLQYIAPFMDPWTPYCRQPQVAVRGTAVFCLVAYSLSYFCQKCKNQNDINKIIVTHSQHSSLTVSSERVWRWLWSSCSGTNQLPVCCPGTVAATDRNASACPGQRWTATWHRQTADEENNIKGWRFNRVHTGCLQQSSLFLSLYMFLFSCHHKGVVW